MANADRQHREPLLKQTTDYDVEEGDGHEEDDVHDCDGRASNGFGSLVNKNLKSTQGKDGSNSAHVVQVQSPGDKELLDKFLSKDDLAEILCKFPQEKWKTLAALGFALLAGIFNTLTLAIIHDRLQDASPLPDIGFDLILKREWGLDAAEVLLLVATLGMLVVMLLHKHRFIVLRRYFLIFGICFLMRGLSMLVTQVPVSSTSMFCFPKANSTNPVVIAKRVMELTSGLGMSMNGHHHYCGDYIFSGHTVSLTLSYLLIKEYTPRRCVLLHWLSWMTSVTAAVFLLVAHAHYTIDILIGYYVATQVFYVYHTMANNMDLKTPGSSNHLTRMWWFCIFDYFETNVKDRVPMQYDWTSFLSSYWPMELPSKGELNI